jgi:hypothetical protein
MEGRAADANWTAAPIVVGALWGLSMLATGMVMDAVDSSWKFLIVPLPVVLFVTEIVLLYRTVKRPDPMRLDAPDVSSR